MSKVKPPKSKGIPSKHLHARTTFLYQAATYLTLQHTQSTSINSDDTSTSNRPKDDQNPAENHPILALQLASDLQQVSRKAQLRLSVSLKRSLCKSCNAVLIPGRTATQIVENTSKGGKKPKADIFIVTCKLCGCKKKFPIGAERQPKKALRNAKIKQTKPIACTDETLQSDEAIATTTEVESITG